VSNTVSDVSGNDALALGQRVVAVLETGLRTATYKLAVLQALVDHCVENLPDDPDAALHVPFDDLADRVIEIYWPQLRPFEGHDLRQSTQTIARIPRAVARLQNLSRKRFGHLSLERVRTGFPAEYTATRREVVLTLVEQPLRRLQRLPGTGGSATFLYDDAWMTDRVSWRQITTRGGLELFPGAAWGLARLSGLLKPVLQVMWVDDIRRLNRDVIDPDAPDIAGHLFGRSRIALESVRVGLSDVFGASCFYCHAPIGRTGQVDHVLPWSRVGIDGLANLVLACARCNSDKKDALPATALVTQTLERDGSVLGELATSLQWPLQANRTRRAARGLYRAEPVGAPTWAGYRQTLRLDISYPPTTWWLV
jgi:hypothetical protein